MQQNGWYIRVHMLFRSIMHTKIKCCNTVATLRAEQGPYEPSKHNCPIAMHCRGNYACNYALQWPNLVNMVAGLGHQIRAVPQTWPDIWSNFAFSSDITLFGKFVRYDISKVWNPPHIVLEREIWIKAALWGEVAGASEGARVRYSWPLKNNNKKKTRVAECQSFYTEQNHQAKFYPKKSA